ncbi:DUF3265 domain-containing protein [Vibrio parahaemolyticus]|nr:DUF3265 domain-containing protein [Vibrio parahaemolyticus]TOF44714.1 DUF3265 domain-containing protein [Vibrio parahaemolyticus]TOO23108.1 DUF3265 domain-containing protein [Vibrio parahaemolyticus]TOP14546.1 DUF3265 domain-containing protein [Vibrio parahaemolyticus]TOQ48151.1 DUF3265 domain-containing protein [Vibrio parahaemolyticus]
MAFVVYGKFSDLGGMRKHRYCVAHHLSGRYALRGEISKSGIRSL